MALCQRGDVAGQRTLWEEGHYPGRLVAYAATGAALLVGVLDLVGTERVGLFYDVTFVLIAVAAALAIRPGEFFVAGVLPPLLMLGSVTAFAVVDRAAVAQAHDGFVQALVSGLAHHATALVIGYGGALAVLALRQVALRNTGQLRPRRHSTPRPQGGPVPAQRPAPDGERARSRRAI
jgi:hypothetical protein